MGKVVGIDLGTTNSLVAFVQDGVPVVIRDASGDALVPSSPIDTTEGTSASPAASRITTGTPSRT